MHMYGVCGLTQYCAIALVVNAVLSASPPPALQLKFDTVRLKNGSEVEFESEDLEPADNFAPGTTDRSATEKATTSDGLYDLLVDLDSISFRPVTYYTYDAYVRDRQKNTWTRTKVRTYPKGPFRDAYESVIFQVINGQRRSDRAIRMPLYNALTYDHLLEAVPSGTALHDIQLATRTLIRLRGKNRSEQLPVKILEVRARSKTGCCWSGKLHAELLRGKTGAVLGPGQSDGIVEISALPLAFNSIKASLTRKKNRIPADSAKGPDDPALYGADDVITIDVDYQSIPGGPTRTLQNIDIPVRFLPKAEHLAITVLLGVALASVVALWLPLKGQLRPRDKGKLVAMAAGLAIIGELIALAAYQGGTSISVMGFSLDPITPLGSIVIGVFCGYLCFRHRDALLSALDKRLLEPLGR